jgi:Glycosyltransferase family 87
VKASVPPSRFSGVDGRAGGWAVDWGRLVRRALLSGAVAVAAMAVVRNVSGAHYGFDYHGIYLAGKDVLRGRSPYLAPRAELLLRTGNAFIPPPVLALLAVPFSVVPFGVSVALWNVGCVAAVVAGLRVLGVRDVRLYVLTLASYPFVSSLILGQSDGLFLLVTALAWRYRDSWRGAVAVGFMIAAKLFAWPLLLWLLITGRIRCSVMASLSAAALLGVSWATIGFQGLADYPQMLRADARAFEARSHSLVAAAVHLGASSSVALVLAMIVCAVIVVAIVVMGRRSDVSIFTAAITLGLLSSPILWLHYLVLLFAGLAVSRRRLDWVWLLAGTAFWLSPTENAHGWQIDLALLVFVIISVAATRTPPDRPADARSTPHAGLRSAPSLTGDALSL